METMVAVRKKKSIMYIWKIRMREEEKEGR
jgi:hypothetical protein